jgi:hypothetical protein
VFEFTAAAQQIVGKPDSNGLIVPTLLRGNALQDAPRPR